MVPRLTRLLLLLFAVSQIAAACGGQGTEVGNPANATGSQPTRGGETTSYQNTDFGVVAKIDATWSATERAASNSARNTEGSCSSDCGAASPTAAQEGIDTSGAPSTLFTDGKSSATLYYLTLASPRNDLKIYLNTIFPGRTFLPFANAFLSGLIYDNPETGTTGGDRQEYYFLHNHSTLLYVVTDLFEVNDGVTRFEAFITSLHFE